MATALNWIKGYPVKTEENRDKMFLIKHKSCSTPVVVCFTDHVVYGLTDRERSYYIYDTEYYLELDFPKNM